MYKFGYPSLAHSPHSSGAGKNRALFSVVPWTDPNRPIRTCLTVGSFM